MRSGQSEYPQVILREPANDGMIGDSIKPLSTLSAKSYFVEGLEQPKQSQYKIDTKSLVDALEVLSGTVHQDAGACEIVTYSLLLVICGLGVWPGTGYAEEFGEQFAKLIIKAERQGIQSFSDYAKVTYLLVNLVVSLRSMEITIGDRIARFRDSDLYKAWRMQTIMHVGVEIGQEAIAVIGAIISSIAVDGLNHPDHPSSVPAVQLFNFITRCFGDAVTGIQAWRSLKKTLFNEDVTALMMGSTGRRQRAIRHSFKSYLVDHLLLIDPETLKYERLKPHISAIADNEENGYAPHVRLCFAGWLIGLATIPYVNGTYVPAFEEELGDDQSFEKYARYVTIASTNMLLGLASARYFEMWFSRIRSAVLRLPTFHVPRLSVTTLAIESALTIGFGLASTSAAVARFAHYSGSLTTQKDLLFALVRAGAAAVGLNLLDLTKTSYELGGAIVAKILRKFDCCKKANEIVLGGDFKQFMGNVIHAAVQNRCAMGLVSMPVEAQSNGSSHYHEDEQPLLSTDEKETIEIPVDYPSTYLLSAALRFFNGSESSQRLIVEKEAYFSAIAQLQAANRAGVDLNEFYQYFLAKRFADTHEKTLDEFVCVKQNGHSFA